MAVYYPLPDKSWRNGKKKKFIFAYKQFLIISTGYCFANWDSSPLSLPVSVINAQLKGRTMFLSDDFSWQGSPSSFKRMP